MIRVLLVDDDALVRAGIRLMLFSASGIEVVGEAADGTEVLGALDRHHPDVILLDLRMPRLDGLAVLDLLRTQPSPPAVVVLTTFDTDEAVLHALRRGAAGFLVKDTPPAEIIRAIELVAAGESMREIALAVAQGSSNAVIAAQLHLSLATVKGHVSALLTKLSLDNRVQIALLVQDAQRGRS